MTQSDWSYDGDRSRTTLSLSETTSEGSWQQPKVTRPSVDSVVFELFDDYRLKETDRFRYDREKRRVGETIRQKRSARPTERVQDLLDEADVVERYHDRLIHVTTSRRPSFPSPSPTQVVDGQVESVEGTTLTVSFGGAVDRYHVEFDLDMLSPADDEVPVFLGEPVQWEISKRGTEEVHRLLRLPPEVPAPLDAETARSIKAELARFVR